MRKYGGERITTFMRMLGDGSDFTTVHGKHPLRKYVRLGSEKITNFNEIEELLGDRKAKPIFYTKSGREVRYPYDFYKSEEFGGKGSGYSLFIENQTIEFLKKTLESYKTKVQGPVGLRINGREVEVNDIVSTPGTPKSDFHMVDRLGNEVAWFSHKAGKTPRDFQQWGGLIELQKIREEINEVDHFLNDVKTEIGENMPRKTVFMREMKNKELTNLSVYGMNYGMEPGQQNVDAVLQGTTNLKIEGTKISLDAHHVLMNGDKLCSDYKPNMHVRYTTGHKIHGIENARGLTMPMGNVSKTWKKI